MSDGTILPECCCSRFATSSRYCWTCRRADPAVLGVLRKAGFTLPIAAHTVSIIDSYIGGFVLQEANLPVKTPDDLQDVASGVLEHLPADEFPHLTEMIVDHALQPGYDYSSEFDYGLELILDALEARRIRGLRVT